MSGLEQLLTRAQEVATNSPTGWRTFECMVRDALRAHDGIWGDRFDEVWLWSEWPERKTLGYPGQDYGIDLVALQSQSAGGGYCAIQCKFGTNPVTTAEINSFIAASATKDFSSRVLVTQRPIAKVGLKKLQLADPPCQVLSTLDMDGWHSDWRREVHKYRLDIRRRLLKLRPSRHELRPYQDDAVQAIAQGFHSHRNGKLILPCGTGKSLVALRAAERVVGAGGTVLYLVPSIALMAQTMTMWSDQRNVRLEYIGVCSDPSAGRASEVSYDDLCELAIPVTTSTADIAERLAKPPPLDQMRVVFSTYQSTPTIAEAMRKLGPLYEFDLAICDEAHRTTGIQELESRKGVEGVSPFLSIHHDHLLPCAKKMFMTATPRVFTGKQKRKIESTDFDGFAYSMDDESRYGPEFYRMSFSDAIDGEWLADYRVVVIAVNEAAYAEAFNRDNALTVAVPQKRKSKSGKQKFKDVTIKMDTALRLAGCWDALATPRSTDVPAGRRPGQVDLTHGRPVTSAIAFCNTVTASKAVETHWRPITETVIAEAGSYDDYLHLDVRHMDGKTPAIDRKRMLAELRSHSESADVTASETRCRVLTNARVLTEGVDVPALDAVVFVQPRASQVDITQAVGRVMRRAKGKERGYIVVPVTVNVEQTADPKQAAKAILDDGDFSAVWKVLRALRSHDERIDYWISNPSAARRNGPVDIDVAAGPDPTGLGIGVQLQLQLYDTLNTGFASMLVDAVGDKQQYASWGRNAARVAAQIQRRLDAMLPSTEQGLSSTRLEVARIDHSEFADQFKTFLHDIRTTVSPNISYVEAKQMLAQHTVTIPVFDAMFEHSQFAAHNPISTSLEKLLELLPHQAEDDDHTDGHPFGVELRPLRNAYQRMAAAFAGAVESAERLDILKGIYDGFFKAAMPDVVSRLGIVYTPIELVDFMLRSVDAVCRKEFGRGLTDEYVNILDPFAGTGTFLARLMTIKDQDGNPIIRDRDVSRKYLREMHCNELVLLAYYISALKIEEAAAERGVFDRDGYKPFAGAVLTDTFLMGDDDRQKPKLDGLLQEASERARRQNKLPIQVIISNPPWSAGQKSSGDDNPNIAYEDVEARVRDTYGRRHKEVTGRGAGKSAGNLFVEAFRWASDRLTAQASGNQFGVVALIHPNSLSAATSLAGMRAQLRDEFSSIYVVNLRGDAYKSGEEFRREGDKLFGGGSRNGVQITICVRNPRVKSGQPGSLHYVEVPEYSSLEQKHKWLADLGDATDSQLREIPLNDHHDWINITDGTFDEMLPVCHIRSQAKVQKSLVQDHALGLTTSCDSYVYSFSRSVLAERVSRMLYTYGEALELLELGFSLEEVTEGVDLSTIKWTTALKQSLKKRQRIEFDASRIRKVLYRPFTTLWLYEDDRILSSVKTISAMFPRAEAPPPADSLVISATNNRAIFAALATRNLPDLSATGTNQPSRAIPRKR